MKRRHPLQTSTLPSRTAALAFLAFVLGWVQSNAVNASGISTHFEAADRAVAGVNASTHPDLAATLSHWPETVRVGGVYPDWGYLWGKTSAAAEDAHWAPFHTTAMQYLHQSYGEPWGLHAERLYCFIAGMACHGAMDDAWHFGRTSFLTQAIARDLQGTDPSQAETMVEVFTDLFVQKDHRPDYEREPWWIPADDLVAIHQLAGHNIQRGGIIRGTTIQRIAFLIENVAWVFAEETASDMLPWTRDNYLTWHDGGVANGADLSAQRMQDLWDEYQVIAVSMPGGGNNTASTHHLHEDHVPRQLWLEAAQRLLEQGAVTVPVQELANGAVELGNPVVVDTKKLLQEIAMISRSN
jgi:hypothetical protein